MAVIIAQIKLRGEDQWRVIENVATNSASPIGGQSEWISWSFNRVRYTCPVSEVQIVQFDAPKP